MVLTIIKLEEWSYLINDLVGFNLFRIPKPLLESPLLISDYWSIDVQASTTILVLLKN